MHSVQCVHMASAMTIGEQLLSLLEQPVTDEMLQQVELLLQQREQAIADAEPSSVSALVAQQASLEGAMRQAMAVMAGAIAQSQRQDAAMRGVHQLLRKGPAGRLLSERR